MNIKLASSKILGVRVTTSAKEEILEFIIRGLKNRDKKFYIVTPNPEMIVHATASSVYRNILNQAQVALPDGVGIIAAGNVLENGPKKRITGVDLVYEIAGLCEKEALSIGLLGSSQGVAEKAGECLLKKYPRLRVSFVSDEWSEGGFEKAGRFNANKSDNIKGQHIDILFVAFGVPKQEEWIAKNLKNIPVTAAMGVGGSFDYISGNVKRAPKFIRNIGMEWAFRLMVQPWRIKRQMALPKFVYLVLKERFS